VTAESDAIRLLERVAAFLPDLGLLDDTLHVADLDADITCTHCDTLALLADIRALVARAHAVVLTLVEATAIAPAETHTTTCTGCGEPLTRDAASLMWADPILQHYHAGCRPGTGRIPYQVPIRRVLVDPFDTGDEARP
jgi:hypothetical protein